MTDLATATLIPAGHTFDIDFHAFRTRITFDSAEKLTFAVLSGPAAGVGQTLGYQVVVLRPGLFAVTWQEPDHTTVVHIEDFTEGQVHANITRPDGSFLRLTGQIIS